MRARIYVQIPAYRDRELAATLTDLFRTAADPDRLRVAVAWQYAEEELGLEPALCDLGRVELLKVPAAASRGCNWARQLLQNRWDGEAYTMLLDSHHRFVPGWDRIVVDLFEAERRAGVAAPLVTGYLPPYDPARDPAGRVDTVYRIALAERHAGLAFRLTGHAVPNWRALDAPIPARFVSLHWLFADGVFNERVPFDPDVYFFADEIAIALRAFTHGYDMVHPHRPLGWHLYDRATRVTHWSDHPGWRAQQAASLRRLRALFSGQLHGPYGIGAVRTVAAYEAHAGIRLIDDRIPWTHTERRQQHEGSDIPARPAGREVRLGH